LAAAAPASLPAAAAAAFACLPTTLVVTGLAAENKKYIYIYWGYPKSN